MATMVRISANIRDTVITNLINKKFLQDDLAIKELYEKEVEARKAMNRTVYEAAFPAKTRKFMEDAAEGMFPMATHIRLRIEKSEGNYHDALFILEDRVRVPFNLYNSGGVPAEIIANLNEEFGLTKKT